MCKTTKFSTIKDAILAKRFFLGVNGVKGRTMIERKTNLGTMFEQACKRNAILANIIALHDFTFQNHLRTLQYITHTAYINLRRIIHASQVPHLEVFENKIRCYVGQHGMAREFDGEQVHVFG